MRRRLLVTLFAPFAMLFQTVFARLPVIGDRATGKDRIGIGGSVSTLRDDGFLVSSFDLFHVGDLDLIAQAGALCDRLEVAVLSDDDVERLTGRPPVVSLAARLSVVSHMRGVDRVAVAEPRLPRFGAPADALVMAGGDAGLLSSADLVLTSSRGRASRFTVDDIHILAGTGSVASRAHEAVA